MTSCSAQIDDLVKILEISRHLVLNQDLQALIRQIEQAAVTVLNCERATVFMYDENADELFSLLLDRPEKIRIPSNCGIAGICFRQGVIVNVPDAYQDPRFNRLIDRATGFRTRAILAAPLFGDQQKVLGVLEVLNKQFGTFEKGDEFLLEVLSAQCGVAIHRQTLIEEFAERKRLQQELAIARDIQKSLLPASAPAIPGYDIAGWSQSAEETGGDFFDFHVKSSANLLMILADVSGHGVGSALLAAECSALHRAIFLLIEDYRLSLSHLNSMLCRNIPGDRFITAFAGYLNARTHEFSFLSAGHGPVFLLRNQQGRIDTLPVASVPLGIMPNAGYDDWQALSLNPGDTLVALTDGFFEWEDSSGHCYGPERVCQSILRHAGLPAARMIENIHRDLLNFIKGTRQQDDLTAVVIKKLP